MELKNKYFLLRHGQTIYQKENRKMNYRRDEDYTLSLTDEGKEMIRSAAEQLKEQKIDLIFSSPFLRTKQSAEIVAGITGAEIVYDNRLVDINMGEFAGRPQEEYSKYFSSKEERFGTRPKNGENWEDVLKRLRFFLSDVEEKYKNKNILVVTHGDPLWLFAGVLKGFTKNEQFLETRKTSEKNFYPKVGELIKI